MTKAMPFNQKRKKSLLFSHKPSGRKDKVRPKHIGLPKIFIGIRCLRLRVDKMAGKKIALPTLLPDTQFILFGPIAPSLTTYTKPPNRLYREIDIQTHTVGQTR